MSAGSNRRLAAAVAAVALACAPAFAQVLYKWTGPDGKVNYADTPAFAAPSPKASPKPSPPPTFGFDNVAADRKSVV